MILRHQFSQLLPDLFTLHVGHGFEEVVDIRYAAGWLFGILEDQEFIVTDRLEVFGIGVQFLGQFLAVAQSSEYDINILVGF